MTHVDLMETCYANRAMYNCHLSEGTSGARSAERDASGNPRSPESARHVLSGEIRGRERSAEEERKGTGHVRGHVTPPRLTLRARCLRRSCKQRPPVADCDSVLCSSCLHPYKLSINQLVKKISASLKVALRSQSAFYIFMLDKMILYTDR